MDAVDRLTPEHLNKVEADLMRIRASLSRPVSGGRIADVKAVIHCHSYLSHDSNGSIDEMAKAARATGTRVIMMTDHPRGDLDVMTQGFSGAESGVLFIPGVEVRNLLIFFSNSRLDYRATQKQLLFQAKRYGGMAFLSHLEEQRDWTLTGLDGSEIYNLHASFKMQARLSQVFRPQAPRDFRGLLDLLFLLDEHPDTGLASICEIPHLYLSAWDGLCKASTLTGIAANDSHANNTLRLQSVDGRIVVTDYQGGLLAELPPETPIPKLIPAAAGLTLTPDSYRVSFAHVGTHLLIDEVTQENVRECLQKGRCYVAFDWIADTYGFSYRWEGDRQKGEMGSVARISENPVLLSSLPTKARLILRKNGEKIEERRSSTLEHRPDGPGAYRMEAYLDVGGERRPWIFSNPIYIAE